MTPWKKHVAKWSDCQLCPLHEVRLKVVLARGKLPCDVLFIGDAPGPNENVIGDPFVGPAGNLLDHFIDKAGYGDLRLGFTNLIGCFPKGEDGTKYVDPPKESILACLPRLKELVGMAKPRMVVAVGKIADKWLPKVVTAGLPCVAITHPGAILRMDVSVKGLAIQRAIVTLIDAFPGTLPTEDSANAKRRRRG